MKVQPILPNTQNKVQFSFKGGSSATMPKIKESKDIFIKRTDNIAFGKKGDDNNLANGLAKIGMVGAPLLLGITAGILMSDSESNPQMLLGSDLDIDANDKSLQFGAIQADADDGIFKVDGTGINIDPSRFDYSDPENGIYANADGSVDIDLLNGRYIDRHNGIYVDADEGISAIVDRAGNVKHFPIFTGSSMSGQSNSGADVIRVTSRFPEGSLLGDLEVTIKQSPLFAKIFGNDHAIQTEDMFGRNIVTALGDDGKKYISTSSVDNLKNTASAQKIYEKMNDDNFARFIQENYPNSTSFALLDIDDDDNPDGIDLDDDGKLDIKFLDTDGDHKYDSVDLDDDGKPDGTLIDIDDDGKPDGIDVDGDGKIDIFF